LKIKQTKFKFKMPSSKKTTSPAQPNRSERPTRSESVGRAGRGRGLRADSVARVQGGVAKGGKSTSASSKQVATRARTASRRRQEKPKQKVDDSTHEHDEPNHIAYAEDAEDPEDAEDEEDDEDVEDFDSGTDSCDQMEESAEGEEGEEERLRRLTKKQQNQ
jgi:hypothetical protein